VEVADPAHGVGDLAGAAQGLGAAAAGGPEGRVLVFPGGTHFQPDQASCFLPVMFSAVERFWPSPGMMIHATR